MTLNISHKVEGKETYFNATFTYHEKLETERLYFIILVPFKPTDVECEHKVVDTSIDLCRVAATAMTGNFVVRALLQNIFKCTEKQMTCPKTAVQKYLNCPGSYLLEIA
jgi:hypothetical protein